MRINAANKLAGMLSESLPDWDFEVYATDDGNAAIAATSKDLQSSFLVTELPPTRRKRGNPDKKRVAKTIASANPLLHNDGVNVFGRTEDYAFDATVDWKRVSVHIYCDADTAIRIARLLGEP